MWQFSLNEFHSRFTMLKLSKKSQAAGLPIGTTSFPERNNSPIEMKAGNSECSGVFFVTLLLLVSSDTNSRSSPLWENGGKDKLDASSGTCMNGCMNGTCMNAIYLLECVYCDIQYVGKSEWPFNCRLNNYRSRIKSAQ